MAVEIDWKRWESEAYVKIVAGRPKVLTFDNVKETTTDIQKKNEEGAIIDTKTIPCLVFHVIKEDSIEVDKELSVTSKALVKKLKPFVEKGFPFTVRITAFGERFEREYEVQAA